jgi:hypothetical protein
MIIRVNRVCFALLVAGTCVVWFTPRPASAQGKGKTARPGERVVLKIERDYLAAVGSSDSPLVAGAKVQLLLGSSGKCAR